MSNLRKLNLSDNMLTRLPENLPKYMIELIVDHNPINTFTDFIHQNIRYLDLSQTSIKNISEFKVSQKMFNTINIILKYS